MNERSGFVIKTSLFSVFITFYSPLKPQYHPGNLIQRPQGRLSDMIQ